MPDLVELNPSPQQRDAWTKAADSVPLAEWLAELADRAAGVGVQSEPVTVKLRKPVKYGSRTVEQITLRPLKAKDMRRYREHDGNMGNAINFASHLSGEVAEVIDEIQGLDLRDVIEAVNLFFLAIR